MGRSIPAWLSGASGLLLLALLGGGPLGEAAFVGLAVLFPVGLIALAVRREPSAPRPALVALGAVMFLSALGVLWLSSTAVGRVGVLGLPLTAWLAGVGLGLVPLVIVVWSYAAAFVDRGRGPGDDGAGRDG